MMLRRDFLRLIATVGSGAAGVVGALGTVRTARAAAFGADVPPIPAVPRARPLGIQLYSLRTIMDTEPERVLAALVEIGYEEVELAGLYGHSATDFRGMLDRAGLRAPAGHIDLSPPPASGPWQEWERTLEDAATLGHDWVVVPWIDQGERTLDGYRRIAERFNAAGEAARAAGLRFAYHNHDFEFRAIDGVIPYDLLLDRTEPDLVEMEMDVYWVVHAGADPLHYFRQHPGRFPLIHVKDRDAEGEMVDVGAGRIDYSEVFAAAEGAGIRHYLIEHDNPESPMNFARSSYRHVRGLLPE